MGISLFSSSKYESRPGLSHSSYESIAKKNNLQGNPDPKNYSVVKWVEYRVSNKVVLVLLVNYPDCKNYEGNKILVYHGVCYEALLKQGTIDPHFCDNSQFHSPIARFEPTKRGWDNANRFADSLL